MALNLRIRIPFRRVTRGEKGKEVFPVVFWKLGKIVPIYGLNFSFKVQFLKVLTRKNQRFFPVGPFFFVL